MNKYIDRILAAIVILCLCYSIPYALATTFSYTFDTATPLGSEALSVIDDRIREIKQAVQERMNVCFYWPLTGTQVSDADAGEVRKILFHEPITTTPTVAASHGDLRIKDVSSKAELHWTDEDENELQITSGGDLYSSAGLSVVGNTTLTGTLDVTGNIDPNSYETTNGGFKDEDDMVSNSATAVTSQQSQVTYIAAQIAAGADPTYSGGESHTFGGGLIFKHGYKARSAADTTVTFATAFPTGVVSANTVIYHASNATPYGAYVKTFNTTTMVVRISDAMTGFYWQAWGY